MAEYTVLSPQTCIISPRAKIGKGAVIYPNNVLLGACVIGAGAVLYPGNILEDSAVGAGARVTASVLTGAQVGAGAHVGPFAHLRPGAQVGQDCRVGSFVEVKASRLGRGVRAGHLAYIGDADVGAHTNIGCGAVFCNYDGAQKYRARVGENCFIGSNVNLIAPLRVGDGCYIAAGTTVTGDLPPGSFAAGRARARVVPDQKGLYRPRGGPSDPAQNAPAADREAPGCGQCACGGEGSCGRCVCGGEGSCGQCACGGEGSCGQCACGRCGGAPEEGADD